MRVAAIASLVLSLMALSYSAMSEGSEKWVTSWAASAQGPYPSGNALVQPDLRLDSDLAGGHQRLQQDRQCSVESIKSAFKEGIAALRRRIPGVRVIGGTLTSALGNLGPAHGFAEQDMKRQALNTFIRSEGAFDGVIDFGKATVSEETGEMRPEFVPDSTMGGLGDRLHPNRIGYSAMGSAVDLGLFGSPPLKIHLPKII